MKFILKGIAALVALALLLYLFFFSVGLYMAIYPAPVGEVLGRTVYANEIRTPDPGRAGGTDEIRAAAFLRWNELHELFARPVLDRYEQAHTAEVAPTAEDRRRFIAYTEARREHERKTAPAPTPEEIEARAREDRELEETRKFFAEIRREHARTDLTPERRRQIDGQYEIILFADRPEAEIDADWQLPGWAFQAHLLRKFGGGRILFQQTGTEAFDAKRRFLEEREAAGEFRFLDPALRDQFYFYWTTDHGHFLIDDTREIERFLDPDWRRPFSPEPAEP